ncbi:hypothetical protein JCM14469_18410 [Desulfatiferula olefinivorans]
MKRMMVVSLAMLLVAALALPAAALENEFGGYWRTRAFSQVDIDGNDSGTLSAVDTRTRIYYTAKFDEKFKFVNKFEFDPVWGDDVAGDIGADGKAWFEIKNSYVDFMLGAHNVKIGIQPGKIARGFIFDEDFSGVTATFKIGDISLPVMWAKTSDDDLGVGASIDNTSRDYLALNPVFKVSDTMNVNPYFVYDKEQGSDTNVFYLGADVDMKMDATKVWGTAIFQGGETAGEDNMAFLLAAGADAGLVHGQFFYASGDDDANDGDNNEFAGVAGRTYYWSEILGHGLFGDTTFAGNLAANAPNTKISNVMALNVGTTVKPMDKLTLIGDVWYAMLAEEVGGEDELGLEVDLRASYAILPNLKLDVVAAYLMAGDAIGDEDPMEFGTMLSLSF